MYKRIEITTAVQPVDGRRRPRSSTAKAKISAALKERKLTAEWIAKRSASRIKNAKGHSREARANMRDAQSGHLLPRIAVERSVAVRKGKPLSEHHRRKLRAVWAKRKARRAAILRPLIFTTPPVQPIQGRRVRGKAMSGSR